eukprot:TRINITY_DN892_c0_g1_i1.p1 TRINITY_DN892_c0_g1~~TRINITY_DN892_c0_g1_i1.p1  ORF type:complete len:485 (-),score=79.00 TRINITY_DN892_c0_g1_i1:80-1534(-)
MKWTLVVLCVTLFLSCAFASDVLDLTDDTVDEALKTHPFILVEFFAPWCGHCKHLAPEYETAATTLVGSDVKLAKVDCTENEKTCQANGVQGYPTLIFFKNGQPKEYNGPRQAAGIVDWVRARSGPRVSHLKTEDEVKSFASDKAGSIYMLGHFDADSEGAKVFSDLSEHADAEEWIFGQVAGSDKKNTIVLHRPFGEDVESKETSTIESILNWAAEHAHPYFGEVASQYARMTKRNKPMVLVFFDENDDASKDLISWVEPIAKEKYSSVSFAQVGKQFHARLPQMGGSGDVIPTAVVLDSQGHKWPFDDKQTFNAENLAKFVDGVVDGSISPFFKSEPIPETNDEPVKVVVGKSFESIVLDETKDVLVEFYAPWCGHCKKLVPVFNQLGEYYAPSKSVVIAKVDSTANDNPSVQVSGFPTIYLFPSGADQKKNPIVFNNERTLESFIQFIEANRQTPAEPELAAQYQEKAPSDDSATHAHDEL